MFKFLSEGWIKINKNWNLYFEIYLSQQLLNLPKKQKPIINKIIDDRNN